jgi:hypothetical protein
MSRSNAAHSTDEMKHGFYFCGNLTCPCGLHVRIGDPGVHGEGNWAELAGGILIGRAIVDGAYLCDCCARAVIEGADALEIVAAPPYDNFASNNQPTLFRHR